MREAFKRRILEKKGNKLKILFINPASINRDALPVPPLGILYLAAYIREKGYVDIKVLDNNFYNYPLEKLEEEIRKYDIIAVTGTTPQFDQARSISIIAGKNKKISIIGGPHATALPEETLQTSGFDLIVIGEGEITLYELLEALKNNKIYERVNGIMFRKNNKFIKTENREFIKNLDDLPFPARDLIPILEYGFRELKRFKGQYTQMMSSRGCTSKCTFCSSPKMWRYCRMQSAERVFEEMLFIYNKYGIKNIHFQDDNLTLSKKRILNLCFMITQSKISFRWSCQTRPDRVDENLLRKMKNAGCVQIEFGVESGDPKILEESKKGYKKEQIKEAFYFAKKVGITTYGFFLIGLPGETMRSWIRSMKFAKELKLDNCVWTVVVPFPGTEIYTKKLVEILNPDYTYWLYKQPIIKVGHFGPTYLKIMRWIADKYINGLFNTGTYRKNIGKRLQKYAKGYG